jgi:DNA-binding transcriptional MerR regulator
MPTEYTLLDLAKLADVTPRTIRFYIAQGLLPAPTTAGPAARYAESHLARLRLIKRLQQTHLPLADIRQRMRGLTDEQIDEMGEAPTPPSTGSALDYIRGVLGGRPTPAPAVAEPSQPMYVMAAPAASIQAPPAASIQAPPAASIQAPPAPAQAPAAPAPAEPNRSQWDRISLDPDVELHIRRPLTRQQNKRVERLITIARQLLEED